MVFRSMICAAATIAVTCCFASPAAARRFPSAMTEGDIVASPGGYVDLCHRDPVLCRQIGGNEAETGASAEALGVREQIRLLNTINHYVNRHVIQRADIGPNDFWNRPGTQRGATGDCEDLAIEKRVRLISAGFPAEDLYFAVGYQRRIGLHLVLVAHLPDGDYVLDSRTPYMAFWADAPYTWVMRQQNGNADLWRSALPSTAGTALAAVTPPSIRS